MNTHFFNYKNIFCICTYLECFIEFSKCKMLRTVPNDDTVRIRGVSLCKVFHDVRVDEEVGPQLLLPDEDHHGHGGGQQVLQ